MAHGFHHAAHLAVAPLRDRHTVPTIGAFAAALFDRAKLGQPILQLNPGQKPLFFFSAQSPQDAHRVFALQPKTGVHQLVSQLARAGEQQQALGVQVQATHRLPFALGQAGQAAKHRGAVLRVVVGDHLASGFVVGDHAGWRRVNAVANGLAVDLDLVTVLHPLANVGRLVVDRDAALQDQLLHFQTRTQAGLGQHLVQFGGFHLRQQDPLQRRERIRGLVRVKLTGHHILKAQSL